MKYKLINKTTGEEHLCDKVVVDGWDYYVSENYKDGDYVILPISLSLAKCVNGTTFIEGTQKVIATNNPSIDIPKVVDEVEMLAHKYFAEERFNWEQENPNGLKAPQSLIKHYNKTFTPLFRAGYNKSQETHPFSEEDMIDFYEWIMEEDPIGSTPEILQLWKEQRPKTLYYE